MYRERLQSYCGVVDNLADSLKFQQAVLNELETSGVPQMPGMAFDGGPDINTAVEERAAGGSAELIVLALLLAALITCVGACSFAKWLVLRRWCQCLRPGTGSPTELNGKNVNTDSGVCQVKPFDEDLESQICSCSEEVAPGNAKCWKCGG